MYDLDPNEPEMPAWFWVLALLFIAGTGVWLYHLNSGLSP